jgi:hypothetical protein
MIACVVGAISRLTAAMRWRDRRMQYQGSCACQLEYAANSPPKQYGSVSQESFCLTATGDRPKREGLSACSLLVNIRLGAGCKNNWFLSLQVGDWSAGWQATSNISNGSHLAVVADKSSRPTVFELWFWPC